MPPLADDSLTPQAVTTVGHNQAAPPDGKEETAHVLFLDVVGFTKLRPARQRSILGKLQDIVRRTEDFCAAKTNKELIALPTGDGMALVFLNALGGSGTATSCAEKVAEALLKHNETTTEEDVKIKVRMGIHSGNVVRVSDVNDRPNVAGEGINTAQRVMDCGDIGHILLSDHAFHLLPGIPDRFEHCLSLGKVKVKHDQEVRLYSLSHDQIGNQETPQRIRLQVERRRREVRVVVGICLLVIVAVIAALVPWLTKSPPSAPSLAVLPFQPETSQYSSRAVSKALTEEFIRSFKYLTNITPRVLPELKSALNQNSPGQTESSRLMSALEAGKKFSVRYVLTGTVKSDIDNANLNKLSDDNPDFDVAVNAELYDTEAGSLVWSKRYKSKQFNQLIGVQESIMEEVAKKIGVTPNKNVENLNTREANAHWSYLLGRFWSLQRAWAKSDDKENFTRRAIKSYQDARAIGIDPYNALALAGLADIYISGGGVAKDPKDARNDAIEAALEATEVAKNSGEEVAEVYAAIGTEKWWLERDFLTARIAFQLAIKLNPYHADSHKRYSNCLAALGKKVKAEEEIKLALEMEPDSEIFQLASGQNSFFAGDYNQAIERLRTLIEKLTKNNLHMPAAYRFLAMALEQKEQPEEALEQLEKAKGESKDDVDYWSARAHILAGWKRTGEALEIAKNLEELRKEGPDYVSPYDIAVIYAAITDRQQDAFDWLEKASKESDPRVTWLNVDPRFSELQKSSPEKFNNSRKNALKPQSENRASSSSSAK